MRARQQPLLTGFSRQELRFGGLLNQGKRKAARPFSHRVPIHVVLKSSRARGSWSLKRHSERVERLLRMTARAYQIRVFYHANVGNHLHLLIRTESRSYPTAKAQFQAFLRRFSGELAFQIMGAKKGEPKGRFWDAIPFSRLVHWGRDFARARVYVFKNLFETAGLWDRKRNPEWEVVEVGREPLRQIV